MLRAFPRRRQRRWTTKRRTVRAMPAGTSRSAGRRTTTVPRSPRFRRRSPSSLRPARSRRRMSVPHRGCGRRRRGRRRRRAQRARPRWPGRVMRARTPSTTPARTDQARGQAAGARGPAPASARGRARAAGVPSGHAGPRWSRSPHRRRERSSLAFQNQQLVRATACDADEQPGPIRCTRERASDLVCGR